MDTFQKLNFPQFYHYKKYKQHFEELVQLERREEIDRHLDEIKQMSAARRAEAGRAILNLKGRNAGHGLGGAHLVKLVSQIRLPYNEISVGDLVILSTGQPNGKEPQATVTEKTNFAVTVAFNSKPPPYAYKRGLRLDLFANDIVYQRMLEALKEVKRHDVLLNLLLGKYPFYFNDGFKRAFFNPQLNETQQLAAQSAVRARPAFLIHGPPGTGKTTTVVEAIQQSAKQGEHILATADSNTAVDNLVSKLVEQNVKVIRIGNPARINQDLITYSLDYQLQDETDYQQAQKAWENIDELKEQQKQFIAATGQSRRGLRDKQIRELAAEGKTSRGIPPGKIQSMARWLDLQEKVSEKADEALKLEQQATRKLLDEATVVCATNATAGASILEDYRFDTVVIDEATQSIEPATLVPMVKGWCYIMAGDHQQLPPTVLNREAQQSLQITLFERLRAQYSTEMNGMLTVQYRMHEAIMAFPNQAFYDTQLKAHPSVANHSLESYEFKKHHDALPAWVVSAIQPSPVSLFLNTKDAGIEEQAPRSYSYRNPTEASALHQLGEALITAGLPPQELGIISPYQEQVRLLKDLFGHPSNPEVKTVDGFQGREKTVILLSFVRSNKKGELGFLTDYRRLNVALTRARRKLIMVGNANMLSQNKIYGRLLEQVETHELQPEQEAR